MRGRVKVCESAKREKNTKFLALAAARVSSTRNKGGKSVNEKNNKISKKSFIVFIIYQQKRSAA